MASIDRNQNVIYIGSISKTFAPALRIGFMTGPSPFVEAAASLRELTDRHGDTLLEEAFAAMFENGDMERHFRKSLKIYKQQMNFFCQLLKSDFHDEIAFKVPEGGLAVWCNFNKKIDLVKMSEDALTKGLYIDNGNYYKNETFFVNGLRMGFASLNENEITNAPGILKKTLQ